MVHLEEIKNNNNRERKIEILIDFEIKNLILFFLTLHKISKPSF